MKAIHYNFRGYENTDNLCYAHSLLIAMFSYIYSPFRLFNCEKIVDNDIRRNKCNNMKNVFCSMFIKNVKTISQISGIDSIEDIILDNEGHDITGGDQGDPSELFSAILSVLYRKPYLDKGEHDQLVVERKEVTRFVPDESDPKKSKMSLSMNVINEYHNFIPLSADLFTKGKNNAILNYISRSENIEEVEFTGGDGKVYTHAKNKRFVYPKYDCVVFMNNTLVDNYSDFNRRNLKLNPPLHFMLDGKNFFLYSVVCHSGAKHKEGGSGHYTCIIHDGNNNFYLYNDMSYYDSGIFPKEQNDGMRKLDRVEAINKINDEGRLLFYFVRYH